MELRSKRLYAKIPISSGINFGPDFILISCSFEAHGVQDI